MNKRPKFNRPTEIPGPPAWLAARVAGDAGKGVSTQVLDRGFWLEDPFTDIWVEALQTFDQEGDLKVLLALLRSKHQPSEHARYYLADMLERYQLKPRPGRKRIPAYDRTALQATLIMAEADWMEEKALPRESRRAQEEIAAAHGIRSETFIDHLTGKRKQSRVVNRRVPRP